MTQDVTKHTPGPHDLDPLDRRLLEAIQRGVPLVRRPFAALAEPLGTNEREVMDRIRRLRALDMISRISGIFETRALGYASVLVAARYPPDRVDAAAAVINEHPGVSHNYLRDAEYNLWYTLAVPPDSKLGLEATAATLSRLSGALAYRLLPATRVFKIGVQLALVDDAEPRDGDPAEAGAVESPEGAPCLLPTARLDLTEDAKAVILALQRELPIEPAPFDRLAAEGGLHVEQMLAAGRDFLARGVMRRYAAVLRHRNVGYTVNCMTVWRVPAGDAERVGAILAGFLEVTHCYLRPAWPDWPYNLYAMVHCRTEAQCRDLLERMRAAAGTTDMRGLYTTKEYKKARLEYFSPAFAAWEQRYG